MLRYYCIAILFCCDIISCDIIPCDIMLVIFIPYTVSLLLFAAITRTAPNIRVCDAGLPREPEFNSANSRLWCRPRRHLGAQVLCLVFVT